MTVPRMNRPIINNKTCGSFATNSEKSSLFMPALIIGGFLSFLFISQTAFSQNVALEQLLEYVVQRGQEEKAKTDERELRFLDARDEQRSILEKQKSALKQELVRNAELSTSHDEKTNELEGLQTRLRENSGDLDQLFSSARQFAGDTKNTISQSIISAEYPERETKLAGFTASDHLPQGEDLESLWLLMLDEMVRTAEVSRFSSEVITASGRVEPANVTRIGPFTALSGDVFLRYLPGSEQLMELSQQPSLSLMGVADDFQSATKGTQLAPIDPSRGAILPLLGRRVDFVEHLRSGGLIGLFILFIGALGLLLIAMRYFVLSNVLRAVKKQLKTKKAVKNNPLGRIIVAAESASEQSADAVAIRLEEATQKEITPLQWGLGFLVILATVTPLLGLLGTVTGMIKTFQAITLFGTGDPKLMSGGISQALVTTELGLAVAIPIMLLHGVVSSKAKQVITILDERCTSLLAQRVAKI